MANLGFFACFYKPRPRYFDLTLNYGFRADYKTVMFLLIEVFIIYFKSGPNSFLGMMNNLFIGHFVASGQVASVVGRRGGQETECLPPADVSVRTKTIEC